MNKCAAELFVTFALVFAGTGAVIIDSVTGGAVGHAGIAITFGLVVMAMIYAVGDVSGAHLNPAVTAGFWMAGRLPGRRVFPYIVSQLCGGILASAVLRMMFSNRAYLGATLPAGSALQSFVLEAVLTGLLMFVILSVSTGTREMGMIAGIAVGGVIAMEAMFAGPISGASMNPARSLGAGPGVRTFGICLDLSHCARSLEPRLRCHAVVSRAKAGAARSKLHRKRQH